MEFEEVECEFYGAVIPLSKAVKIDLKTGGYKYACPNCAKKWK